MDRSNPDFAQIWRDKYDRAVRDYQAGGSEVVLRASLRVLGYAGVRLEAEVTYQADQRVMAKPFKSLADVTRQVVTDLAGRGGFTSGLQEDWW